MLDQSQRGSFILLGQELDFRAQARYLRAD